MTEAPALELTAWARPSTTSALQTMLSVGTRPGTPAPGVPAPELFPAAEYGRAAEMIEEAVARQARAARTAGAQERGSRRPNHAVPSSRLTP